MLLGLASLVVSIIYMLREASWNLIEWFNERAEAPKMLDK